MKAITRRAFMRLAAVSPVVGAAAAGIIVSNASDAADAVWPEVKALVDIEVIETDEPTDKEGAEYNVVKDLVEEMNKHDAENPELEFRYFIHCNYSGLGILNRMGRLERELYEPNQNRGYMHSLWLPLNLGGCYTAVSVGTTRVQKADIFLIAQTKGTNPNGIRDYEHSVMVTSRYFDVDYTELGEALMQHALCHDAVNGLLKNGIEV